MKQMKNILISGDHENPAAIRDMLRRVLTGLAITLDKPTFCPVMGTDLGVTAFHLLADMKEEYFAPISYEGIDPDEEAAALENAYLLIHNLNEDELSLLTAKHPDLELISAGQEL